MVLEYHINGGDFVNAGKASSAVKGVLKQMGVSGKRIKRVVIALYELEVNVVAHAHKGWITVLVDADRITIEVKDAGPGIADISLAMKEGYSTASREVREMGFGAGMGLPNIKRNSDSFHIESKVDEGVIVKITNELKD